MSAYTEYGLKSSGPRESQRQGAWRETEGSHTGDATLANSETGHVSADKASSDRIQQSEDNEKGLTDDTVKRKNSQEERNYDFMAEKELEGTKKYSKLSWQQLVVVLIVEAIALGSLSIPSAFATLGMVAGTIITVGVGFLAIGTSASVGYCKLKYPQVQHYSDVGLLLGGPGFWGKFLREVFGAMFTIMLVLLVGSHCLTGTIAFGTITAWPICSLVFGVVSAVLLFLCAVPPSFSEQSFLGIVDFISIIAAILITLIATGIKADNQAGSFGAVNWSALPPADTTFAQAMVAVTNIVFAYSFAICQFSFMQEMHTPADFPKAIWTLGIIEILIYTLTGALGYAFVGNAVQSPALLSAGNLISRIAFGVALPVIFISGAINTVTVCRYLLDRYLSNSTVKYVNTFKGWAVWLGMISTVTILAFVIAEAIPFFSSLLAIMSSLFISGFTIYLPAFIWLFLLREGGYFEGLKNTVLTIVNVALVLIGFLILVGGFYSSVVSIKDEYAAGSVGSSFTCKPL